MLCLHSRVRWGCVFACGAELGVDAHLAAQALGDWQAVAGENLHAMLCNIRRGGPSKANLHFLRKHRQYAESALGS